MDWRWYLVFHLLFGILLAEGLIIYNKQHRVETRLGHYLICLLIGPLAVLIMLGRR